MRPLLALLSMVALGLVVSWGRAQWAPQTAPAAPLPPAAAPPTENRIVGAGATGGVRVVDSVERYAVAGATESELLESLVAAGPRIGGDTFFGLTVTQLSYRYTRQPEGAQCVLRGATAELSVTTTLPAWQPLPAATPALRRDWNRFETALARHEARHRQMAVAWAGRVRAALEGLAAPTCALAEAEGRARVDRLRTEADAEHRRYDAETGHGLTEGAAWPLRR